jgi:hypothetical protein
MDGFFRAIARFVAIMTISLGVRPPVVALLELLRRPSARVVMISRRRLPEDAELFTIDGETECSDEDTTRQSTIRRYIPVRTA